MPHRPGAGGRPPCRVAARAPRRPIAALPCVGQVGLADGFVHGQARPALAARRPRAALGRTAPVRRVAGRPPGRPGSGHPGRPASRTAATPRRPRDQRRTRGPSDPETPWAVAGSCCRGTRHPARTSRSPGGSARRRAPPAPMIMRCRVTRFAAATATAASSRHANHVSAEGEKPRFRGCGASMSACEGGGTPRDGRCRCSTFAADSPDRVVRPSRTRRHRSDIRCRRGVLCELSTERSCELPRVRGRHFRHGASAGTLRWPCRARRPSAPHDAGAGPRRSWLPGLSPRPSGPPVGAAIDSYSARGQVGGGSRSTPVSTAAPLGPARPARAAHGRKRDAPAPYGSPGSETPPDRTTDSAEFRCTHAGLLG